MKTQPLALVVAIFTLAAPAVAGPPLICHPFDIGSAQSLPWSGPGKFDVSSSYDVDRLATDTLALLTPATPVIVRMETMRRATVYAYVRKRPDLATQLLDALQKRVNGADKKNDPLGVFDVGYLAATYRQMFRERDLTGGIDGLSMIERAIELRGGDAQMELAAAIATLGHGSAAHRAHLDRAVAGAARDSLLAKNLVVQADLLESSKDAMRARIGS